MKLRGRDLSIDIRESGDDVALLHRELQRLGHEIEPSERAEKTFGESTRKAVLDFQRSRGLEANGAVSTGTARLINAVDALLSRAFVAKGRVVHADGSPLTGLTVRKFDQDTLSAIPAPRSPPSQRRFPGRLPEDSRFTARKEA